MYSVGSLIRVRGRDWVVLPSQVQDWIFIQPLGGTSAETVAIHPDLEESIESATFPLPDPKKDMGGALSCSLLLDAVRLGFRSTTSPFRSFGKIAVEPRAYQVVPLLMALKQETVRLLISDGVGIGKTIEAGLIAREFIDRGEITRLTVLCPPQLAEQWQDELEKKFHIKAQLVLPSTVSKLERGLSIGTSVFEAYPYTVTSLEYVKNPHHRDEFIRCCPDFVIVDEAHACAGATGASQQRYRLIRELSLNPKRHMLFVTATPHSGKQDVFRSLLSFLKPEFKDLPEDFSGEETKELAKYFIQRQRSDICQYMNDTTTFPECKTEEKTWSASTQEMQYFKQVLALARRTIALGEDKKDEFSKRIFWWSALALLRAASSSPAAAIASLHNRIADKEEEFESLERTAKEKIYDGDDSDDREITDTLIGMDATSDAVELTEDTRKDFTETYKQLKEAAEKLTEKNDSKLKGLIELVGTLYKKHKIIVFCRFIHTAEYVKAALEKEFDPKNEGFVQAVTGMLAPDEREARVLSLSEHSKRILVCTDCLSEGINLQQSFDALIHYDLSWNPTRHEQREGRINRFGQASPEVKVITYYCKDNFIDGYVLDVLLRKSRAIRAELGIAIPFPGDKDSVIDTIVRTLLLKKDGVQPEVTQLSLPLDEFIKKIQEEKKEVCSKWDEMAAIEKKRSKSRFAHANIRVEEVERELALVREAGASDRVEPFVHTVVQGIRGVITKSIDDGKMPTSYYYSFDKDVKQNFPELDLPDKLSVVFRLPATDGQEFLSRTHPFVEKLANYVFDTAMDPEQSSLAKRTAVVMTGGVEKRTTLLVCRFRFQLTTLFSGAITKNELTEDCIILGFTGSPEKAVWLTQEELKALMPSLKAQANPSSLMKGMIQKVIDKFDELMPHVQDEMKQRGKAFEQAYSRVRRSAQMKGIRYKVSPQGTPDILGIFMYFPVTR